MRPCSCFTISGTAIIGRDLSVQMNVVYR
jgi:hypothetical protein